MTVDYRKITEIAFTYHPPTGDQPERYTKIRDAAKDFAMLLHDWVPDNPDRSKAIELLRECVMHANAAIALHEPMRAAGVDLPSATQPTE